MALDPSQMMYAGGTPGFNFTGGVSQETAPNLSTYSTQQPAQPANDWTGGNPFLGQANPYLQQNIDATNQNTIKNYQLATAPQMASRQAASGSFGNSGLDQIQGEQQRQLGQTLGNTDASMRMQDYNNQQQMYQWDQGFNANQFQQGINNDRNNLQDYMGLLSTGNQFNNQDLTNANNIYNQPMNYLNNFSNLANGTGNGFGTSTSSTPLYNNPAMGALGGWQLGSQFGRGGTTGGGNVSNLQSQYNNVAGPGNVAGTYGE